MAVALNDKALKGLFARGQAIVEPFNEHAIQPASIDLRLGNTTFTYNLTSYILGEQLPEADITKESFDSLVIESGRSAFVGIYEKMTIPEDMIGFVVPRSSITRLGIQIISTYMNPGYSGYMPLTIVNHTNYPITLRPGCRVAQLVLFRLNDKVDRPYKNRQENKYYAEEVDHSKLHLDEDIEQMIDTIISNKLPSLSKLG